jgi:hypothetical protein
MKDYEPLLDINEDDDLSLACLMIEEEERREPLLKLGPGGDYVEVYYPEDF